MMTVFAKNLKRFRLAKHLTQEQAAEDFGVSAQSVSRWECGTTFPDVAMLPQIARLYCVSIDDLYKENSVAYDNYAQRLGAVYESTGKIGDFVRADQEYRKLLRSGEYSMEDLRLYGVLHQLLMEESREQALTLFDRVLMQGKEADPETYWRTMRQKIYLNCISGKGGETIRAQLGRLEENGGEINEWICAIAACQFCQRFEEAENLMLSALERFPADPCLYVFCGDVYAGLKRYEEAFRYWEKAFELDEDFVDALYSMGFCYEEMGEYGKAIEIWEDLADRMEAKGFDIEVNYPRSLAKKCAEKLKT